MNGQYLRTCCERHPKWNGRSKTVTICRSHDIIYENPKDPVKNVPATKWIQ